MSYRNFPDQLPSRRFAIAYCGRIAAANYHGARIARLLATKMGMQPVDVLPLMARPLAREAARALGLSSGAAFADFVGSIDVEGGRRHGG
jgi:hypothetical protein